MENKKYVSRILELEKNINNHKILIFNGYLENLKKEGLGCDFLIKFDNDKEKLYDIKNKKEFKINLTNLEKTEKAFVINAFIKVKTPSGYYFLTDKSIPMKLKNFSYVEKFFKDFTFEFYDNKIVCKNFNLLKLESLRIFVNHNPVTFSTKLKLNSVECFFDYTPGVDDVYIEFNECNYCFPVVKKNNPFKLEHIYIQNNSLKMKLPQKKKIYLKGSNSTYKINDKSISFPLDKLEYGDYSVTDEKNQSYTYNNLIINYKYKYNIVVYTENKCIKIKKLKRNIIIRFFYYLRGF